MIKIVLIERDAHLYASWKTLPRAKRFSDLSVEEIVRKYQGFEGEIVDLFEIKDGETDFTIQITKLLELRDLGVCFLLCVISGLDTTPPFLKNYAVNLGYDVGICAEEETEIYSSIFHEILFGGVDELAEFKNSLNESFLFSNKAIAEEYVSTHEEMDKQGRDVEHEKMFIYEIWRFK